MKKTTKKPAKKTTKKTTRVNNRPAAELTGWCQVRIPASLAAAVGRLKPGVKSTAVRAALEAACREARIPLKRRPADRRQLALPIVAKPLPPRTTRQVATPGQGEA